MVKAWRAGPGGTFNCPHCRAVYKVTVKRAPLKAEGSATCGSCGSVMAEWSGKVVPSFQLVPDPDRKGASDGNAAQSVVGAIAEVVEKAVGRVVSVESIRDSE
jgi:predicted Zn finger-like uncharacterized protein